MSASIRVVIVGGGFAGMTCARTLARATRTLPGKIQMTIIDRRNHHLFQPLLYQVATAGLSPAEIAVPIRSEFARYPDVRVAMSDVTEIDRTRRQVQTREGEIYVYDWLVLATGATHSYFGHDEWERFAPGLKTVDQALEIRRRVLTAFERAEKEPDVDARKALLTFVIVGGGPTGVELAGAIAEISRYTLSRDFRQIDPSRTRVILIEAGARVLSGFSSELSRRAARDLEELGVQVWTSTRVSQVTAEGVQMSGGAETVRARTVIWAAGVKPSPLGVGLGVACDPTGRVPVSDTLQLLEDPRVFVLGDLARFVPRGSEAALPGLAPVAMQQGRHIGRELARVIRSGSSEKLEFNAFRYRDKGMMATIGRSRAVVELGKFKLTGFLAWSAWLFVHIFYLIGFQNRLFVFLRWAKGYLTLKRGARLI